MLCDTHMTPSDDGIEPQWGAAAEESKQRQEKVVLREGGRVAVHWRVVPVCCRLGVGARLESMTDEND